MIVEVKVIAFDGDLEVSNSTCSSVNTVESISCGPGAWFESVLEELKSSVGEKLKEAKSQPAKEGK